MLRSPRLTLVEKECNHELQMVDVDGQPSECSADIFLEHHEIAAAREAPPYDAEENVHVVISEGLVSPRSWVDKRFCQVIDLPVGQNLLASLPLDLLNHEAHVSNTVSQIVEGLNDAGKCHCTNFASSCVDHNIK